MYNDVSATDRERSYSDHTLHYEVPTNSHNSQRVSNDVEHESIREKPDDDSHQTVGFWHHSLKKTRLAVFGKYWLIRK
jgi:hypothetical protein